MAADEVLAIIAGIVSFWEDSTGAELVQAYPTDWDAGKLYVEWKTVTVDAFRKRKEVLMNGTSTGNGEFAGQLKDLLQTVEATHGIVIDHLIMKRSEGRVSVLWHKRTERIRRHGYVPAVGAAAAPVQTTIEERRVEA